MNAKQGVDGRLMAPYAMESDGTITLEKSVLLLFRKWLLIFYHHMWSVIKVYWSMLSYPEGLYVHKPGENEGLKLHY